MRALASAPARRATFTEEKSLAALSAPLYSRGTLSYRRPDHLEKLTLAPRREALVIDGDRLTLTEGDAAPRRIDLAAQPALRPLVEALRAPLAGDLPALRRGFVVQSTGMPAAWRITLTPRAEAAKLLDEVVLDGGGDAITRIALRQANGDRQVLAIAPQPIALQP